MFRETAKPPRVLSQSLQASISMLNVRFKFAKLHLDKPQNFWNNVLWTDETQVEMSGHNAQHRVWQKIKHSISAKTPYTNCDAWWFRGDDLGLFCSQRTWVSHSHWVNHKFLSILKYSRVKYETICLTAEAWPKLGHTTGQWFQAHQQICNRIAVAQSVQTSTNWNAVAGP